MPAMNFGQIGDYVKEHPKASAVAVVGTAGIIFFVVLRRPKGGTEEETDPTAQASYAPLESQPIGAPAQYSNYPIINVTTPPAGRAPEPATEPGRSFQSIVREGRTMKVTAGPPGICPPGYVSAQQPGQAPRCTLASDANKKPGQRTSFVPSLGQGAYVTK